MVVIKMWCYFRAFIQKVFYKIIYRKNLLIGKGVTWRRGFSVMKMPEAVIQIGDNCFFNNDCSINSNHLIKMGGVLFGENVKIYDHNHRFNEHKPIKAQGFSNGTVTIGERCWIGSNVTILKGSKIGNNCVIGAGCVISGKVPDNSIVRLKQTVEIEEIQYR